MQYNLVAGQPIKANLPPVLSYLLQTSRASRAGERVAVERAALVQHGNHILRTDRLDRTLDLVDVLTEVAIQVAVVVAEVSPLQFTHRELRGEAECSFTDILLGNETLEALASDDEADLVGSLDPSRVAALGKPVRDSGADDGVDQNEIAILVEASSAEGLLVDTERKATIALELITSDAVLAQLEAASGEIEEILFHIGIVADVLDGIGSKHDLEELAVLGRERLGKHFLAEESTDTIQRLEVQRPVRKNLCELRVDLLHVASQVLTEALGAVHDILNARLDQELITDISVDDLEDGLLKGDLRLQIRTLEGGTSLLDADARASPTEGLQLELILGRADLIGSSTNTAEGGVIHEGRSGEGSSGNRHFLDNGADDIRDIGESPAVDGVDIGRLTSQHLRDLPNDAVDILGGEVLDCSQGDTFRHFVWLSFPDAASTILVRQHQSCTAVACDHDTNFGLFH